MAKRLKYNSDYMSDKMDSYMEQIEDKLSALYADAAKEMQDKLSDFMEGFEKQDANMQAQVEAGKITQEEYSQWRNRHIVQSDKYKSTIDSLSTMAVNADVAAMAMVNGAMPMVVAQSYNFTESLGFEAANKAGLTQGTFQIYNERSVQKLIKDNPNLLKDVDMDADKKWNTEKMNREITQGIIQGEPIEKVADRLQRVTDMDRNAAVRNARTMMTGAENMGRAEAADDLKKQGIPMDEVWSATYDNRTRESHLELDGTVRDENGLFGADFLAHPLRYPADPLGDPEEIYNCRCRLSLQIVGIDHSKDQELYENFMKENFPQTWETMQEKDSIKNALDTYSKKQEEMPPRPIREMIPAPEKVSLEDVKESPNMIPEKPERPKKDDFEDYDAYLEARDKFREDLETWKNQRDEYVQNLKENTVPMTREEFDNWANSRGIEIVENTDFQSLGSIDEVDPHLLRIMTDRCGELLDEFPQVLEYRQKMFEQAGMSGTYRFSVGYSTDNSLMADGGIGFTFGGDAKDFDFYAQLHYESVATGHLVNGTGDLRAIIDHEFGHNVQATIATFNGETESEIGRRFAEKALHLDGQSEYSFTNENELFAEAFCAWKGGENTPYAKAMEDFLKEYKMI